MQSRLHDGTKILGLTSSKSTRCVRETQQEIYQDSSTLVLQEYVYTIVTMFLFYFILDRCAFFFHIPASSDGDGSQEEDIQADDSTVCCLFIKTPDELHWNNVGSLHLQKKGKYFIAHFELLPPLALGYSSLSLLPRPPFFSALVINVASWSWLELKFDVDNRQTTLNISAHLAIGGVPR
jgi:hypothetical protein